MLLAVGSGECSMCRGLRILCCTLRCNIALIFGQQSAATELYIFSFIRQRVAWLAQATAPKGAPFVIVTLQMDTTLWRAS